MSIPLFSASHAAQWDVLSTSAPANRRPSTAPWPQVDHDHDMWHWHPSQWPLMLERTASSSTSSSSTSTSTHASTTGTKTLLLSSRVRSGAKPRHNLYTPENLAESEVDEDAAGDAAGIGLRPAGFFPDEPKGGRGRAGDDRSTRRGSTLQPMESTANRKPRSHSTRLGVYALEHKDTGRKKKMAVKTYTWVSLWFLLTVPIIIWDASYCFMRPRSMAGGDLHWIWTGYEIYQEVDHMYGVEALLRNDGFPNAQALLNVVETLLSLTYLYLAHVSHTPAAPVIGLTGAAMTCSKTVLYFAQEYYCGWCATGHNDLATFIKFFIIPNGLWILFPGTIVYTLGKDIVTTLVAGERGANKVALGKKN